jgi:hypothetical protein
MGKITDHCFYYILPEVLHDRIGPTDCCGMDRMGENERLHPDHSSADDANEFTPRSRGSDAAIVY